MKEIERKFLIHKLPDNLKQLEKSHIIQSYIATGDVEIRIRERILEGKSDYKLSFKNSGCLVREEVEFSIGEEEYFALFSMLPKGTTPIIKCYSTYQLENGLQIECSTVDMDKDFSFMYAEVEFKSVEEAQEFELTGDFYDKEVTEDPFWKMSNYWKRTRMNNYSYFN